MKKKYIEKKKNLMHLYIGLNPVGKHVLIFLLMKFPRLVFFMDHPRRLLVTQLILYKNKSGGSHLTDALYRLNFRSVFPPSPAPLPWSHSGEKFESASSFCLKFNQTVILYQFGINWPSQARELNRQFRFATVVYCPHFNVGCIWHSLNSKLTHHSSAL